MKTQAIIYSDLLKGYKKPIEGNDLPTKIGLPNVQVRDFLCAMQRDKVRGYVNNRGTGKASRVTVRRVRDQFDAGSLGQIDLTSFTTERLTSMDGHGRLTGMCEKLMTTGFSKEELNTLVNISICSPEEAIKRYQNKNAGKAHSGTQTITNKDFVFRDIIDEVLRTTDLASEDLKFLDKQSFYPILANVVVALNQSRKDNYSVSTFVDVYRTRRITSKLQDLTRNQSGLDILESEISIFSKAIKHYCVYIKEIKMREKQSGVIAYKHLNKAGWMGTLLSDFIFSEKCRMFYRDPIKLAQQSVKNVTSLAPWLSNICGSNEATAMRCITEANKILRGRKN